MLAVLVALEDLWQHFRHGETIFRVRFSTHTFLLCAMTTRPQVLRAIAPGSVMLLLTLLFWKFRVLDAGLDPQITLRNVDLHIELIPTLQYGFQVLRSGGFPLWNPYQYCGEPFLAVPYAGILYPPQWIFTIVSAPVGIEVMFVCHMVLGGLGMWALSRHFGASRMGGLCAAVTFMWSGKIIFNNTLGPVFEGTNWMPLTVLLVDKVILGHRWTPMALIGALTCQFLLGSAEIFLHAVYASTVFGIVRLTTVIGSAGWIVGGKRAALVVGCGVAAVLLAAPQLLLTVELVQQSTRASGTLTFAQASVAAVPPLQFLREAIEGRGIATVGVLPILGLPLALSNGQRRVGGIAGVLAAGMAALLVFGGSFYWLYYSVPVVGSLFRRPLKFLTIYTCAQAVLVGLSVTNLQALATLPLAALWRRATWLLTLGVGFVGVAYLAHIQSMNTFWLTAVGLLIAYSVVPRTGWREAVVLGLCVAHGASLFFRISDPQQRPVTRPDIFRSHEPLFTQLKADSGFARVYITPQFLFDPGLTAKQGMVNRLFVSVDYQALTPRRYAEFFDRVTKHSGPDPFVGSYLLLPESNWNAMALTGTRYFVMGDGEPGAAYMQQHPDQFRLLEEVRPVKVFEARSVLPRAYVVTRARILDGADAVLDALCSSTFDPRREVLFEENAPVPQAGTPLDQQSSEAHVLAYEPERVALEVTTKSAGFLVMNDAFYPGWKAYVNGTEAPLYRANYLFRGVPVSPGRSEVRFEYHPTSWRVGLYLSAATAASLAVLAALWFRRRRPQEQ